MSFSNRRFPHPLLILAVLAVAAGFIAQAIENGLLGLDDPEAAQVWLPATPEVSVTWIDGFEEGPYLTARAAILFENTTGTVLYAKNPHEQRAPASTTKILTAILALELGNLDDIVTVSRYAASTPGSSARLYTGQKIRLEDLLHGLLLNSGNDAAVAIAEHLAGNESTFVKWMNQRAAALGAQHSRFQNPHGLDKPQHYSTVFDLALLSRVALLYPKFAEIVQKKQYSSESGSWTNTNQLLWSFEGTTGIKTGTTSQAGYCLVASVEKDGMQLISVVLHAGDRFAESRRLLEYGFDRFHIVPLAQPGEVLARLPLQGGMAPVVAVVGAPVSVVVRDDQIGQISTELHFDPKLKAPIRQGMQIGRMNVLQNGKVVKSIALIAGTDVPQRTPWQLLKQWFQHTFTREKAGPSQPSIS